MSNPPPLATAVTRYQLALAPLNAPKGKPAPQLSEVQVLELLKARDEVQAILDQIAQQSTPLGADCNADLIQLAQLDAQLKDHGKAIATFPQLQNWQNSFQPPPTDWWWHFEPPKDPRDRVDWLWNSLTLAALTANLALVTDIASRFFTGAPGVLSSFAAIAPSVLTLFAGGGALTKAGRMAIKHVLSQIGISKHRWHEAQFAISGSLLMLLMIFHTSLPNIARFYNNRGEIQFYEAGKIVSAQGDFQKALALNPDYAKAQFNLGATYEELQEPDKAEMEYRKALSADYLPAYNNLAHLYIVQEEFDRAIPFLQQGLSIFDPALHEPGLAYALHKNLGWARLKQARLPEAEAELQQAIALDPERADAYCLLAQVLEQQDQAATALPQWENCLKYARVQDDLWIDQAQQRIDTQDTDAQESESP
ncbi:MAG: tetratricopeptide repeat protein [Cyanobacteria bacterium J06635_15]